jgi:hypothetical protein
MTTSSQQETVPAVSFRLTTYRKLRRNEPGVTQIASERVCAGLALDWILNSLPEDAIVITPDTEGDHDAVTIRIDWAKVPDPVRYGPPGTLGRR